MRKKNIIRSTSTPSARRRRVLVLGALAVLGSGLPVHAAEVKEGQPVSAQEMEAFAVTARDIQVMRSKARLPVGRAVREGMVERIREHGLTVDRYNTIAERVSQEKGLYARYQKVWRRLGGG